MSALKASMAASEAQAEIRINQKDFISALTKVFPSVSKKDELSYRALEGSLRKTRASIIQAEGEKDPSKPTPKKPFVP